jgi:hypothetical protein
VKKNLAEPSVSLAPDSGQNTIQSADQSAQ